MAIESLHFHNFKVFRDAELRLGRTTLIIGANGTGKSTCMDALRLLGEIPQHPEEPLQSGNWRSLGTSFGSMVALEMHWDQPPEVNLIRFQPSPLPSNKLDLATLERLQGIRVFSFEHEIIKQSVPLARTLTIESNGFGIPAVLTTLQDHYPERFEALTADLSRWLPEFDRILLDTPSPNTRSFMLRTKDSGHKVPAQFLSQGTLVTVALLTLSFLPEPPQIIGIEDPDRGMHPRLLRDVLDAVHRLSHPEDFGDSRGPVQVVMTSHSPYFVDLFQDNLEDVIIAEKQGLSSILRRLSDIPNVQDILRDAHLGETWFTGVLGGVPVHT